MTTATKIYDPYGSGKYLLRLPDHKDIYWHGIYLFGTMSETINVFARAVANEEMVAWETETHDNHDMVVVYHVPTANYYVIVVDPERDPDDE